MPTTQTPSRVEVVNAVDFKDLKFTEERDRSPWVMPISLNGDEEMAECEQEPRSPDQLLLGVNLWDAIKKALTPREFELFELYHKFQYNYTQIEGITGLQGGSIECTLERALLKVRKAFGIKEV